MGEWKTVRLGDIGKFINGGTPSRKSPEYFNGNIPWITSVALGSLMIDNSNAIDYITESAIKGSATKLIPSNSIMIGTRVGVGKVSINTLPMCTNQDIVSIVNINRQIFHLPYIVYCLRTYKQYLDSQKRGATIQGINTDVLKKIEIPVPPIKIQRKTTDILDKVSGLIELRKAQIEKLDLLVKSQFIAMFGDPVTNHMGWEVKTLKEICTKLNDGTHFSPESYPVGDFKYITAKNIKPDGFDFSNITYVSADVHNEIYARCNPEYGDVLYIKDGVTTGIAMVNTLEEPFTLLSSVALLKPNRSIVNGYYLRDALNNNNMYFTIRRSMGGAAITRLTIAKLNIIELPLPPLDLQNQFAAFVKQVDKSKFEIQKSLEKLETLKKALMQKYFG